MKKAFSCTVLLAVLLLGALTLPALAAEGEDVPAPEVAETPAETPAPTPTLAATSGPEPKTESPEPAPEAAETPVPAGTPEPGPELMAEGATSGTCGDNLTWSLDVSTGVLTISGTGEMADWHWSVETRQPWYANLSSIKKVVVGPGVTSIGSYAFDGASHILEAEMADSITRIGALAFRGCTQLAEVRLPAGLTELGDSAFSGCTKLASVDIPESLTTISYSAFQNCRALTSVDIPSSVREISNYAFRNSGLTRVVIPEGVATIGYQAFDTGSLSYVSLPSTLTEIGYEVFSEYSSLRTAGPAGGGYDIEFAWTESIPANAFSYSPLEQVVLPEGIATIGARAFYANYDLTSVTLPASLRTIGDHAFWSCDTLTELVLPEGVETIEEDAFSYCDSLSRIVIPSTVTTMGRGVFNHSELLTTAGPTGGDYNIQLSWREKIPDNAFYDCYQLTSIVLPEGLTGIGADAFINCDITEIIIPEGVVSIGADAFLNCYELSRVTLPASLETIGSGAFWAVSNLTTAGPVGGDYDLQLGWNTRIPDYGLWEFDYLTDITVPEGVTAIGESAFRLMTRLTSISLPDSLRSIGDDAFYSCTGLTSLVIPPNVTTLGANLFYNCENLASLTIPAEVYHVDDSGNRLLGFSGYSGCDSLTQLTVTGTGAIGPYEYGSIFPSSITDLIISEGITSIGDEALSRNRNLSSISFPSTLTSIGRNAFSYCTGLTALSLPQGLISIGDEAFYSSGLTELILPQRLQSIGAGAFAYTALKTASIPEGVTQILNDTFRGCDTLEVVTLPDGVTTIGESAFQSCSALKTVTIPVSVTVIGSYAFSGCEPETITYGGSRTQWERVEIGTGNACLSDPSKIIFLGAEATPGADGSTVVMHKGSCTGQVGSILYVWVDLTAGSSTDCQTMADGLVWTSTDESVFPVNAGDTWKDALVYDDVTGEAFCMVYPQAAGTATVTVTAPGGASSSCTVTVEVPADSVTMDTAPYYIKEGASGMVYAQLTAKDGLTDKIWEWVSSDPSVVAFDLNGTGSVQEKVSVVGGGTLHSTSAAITIYARKPGEATVSCQFPDGSMSYRQVVVTAAEDDRDTIASNYYDVPHYQTSSQEKEGRQYILEYRARWEEAYQGYIDAVGEALAEAEKEGVSAREDSIEAQAKALRAADEGSSSKFLTFPAGFPGGWKDYAYQALCTVLLDAAEQKVDFGSITSTDSFTVSSNIVKQIAKNMSSVQESFTYGGVEIEINMGNYFGLAFGSMTCTKTGLFTGHRSYTVTICSNMTSTNAVVADYLNEIKDLGYSAVANVYFAFAQDILGKPLSELTKPYLTRTLGKLAGRLDQYGLGKPYDVLMDCWQYYENWKSVYNKLNQIQPSAAQALLNAVNLDSQTADNPLVKKALKKVDQALRDLSDATLEYITEDGLVTPPEDEHSWFDRIFNFNCPVSVEVYALDGTLLGQVDDNGAELTGAGEGRIAIDESGGAKRIRANEDLTFRLVGQDYGTMSCYVEEYDEAGTPVGRLNFYDIALEPRMELTASSTGTGKDSLTVTVNDEAIRPSEYIPVTDSARVTVEVATEKGGQVVGGGAYVRGDGVVLYALADEGYKFAGWFDSQGSPVSSNAVYEFTAREERALTARFVEQQPPSLTNYAPSLTEAYKGRCTVEAEQEGDTLRVTLNWIDQSASMPGFTALLARYRDNGQLEQLSVLTPQTQDKAVTFTGTVPEEGATLFLLDCDQCPVFEAYMSE